MIDFRNYGKDARLHGAGCYTATAGDTTDHFYTFSFGSDFSGIEIITDSNTEIGDYLTLETQYYAGETHGWKRYKKFGKEWYVAPNDRNTLLLFPTKPQSGVRIKISYTATGLSDVKFAINLFTFTEIETVDTSVLGEGMDW